jgi:hypothetical protein
VETAPEKEPALGPEGPSEGLGASAQAQGARARVRSKARRMFVR